MFASLTLGGLSCQEVCHVEQKACGQHSTGGVRPLRGTPSRAPTLLGPPGLALPTPSGAGWMCLLMLAWLPWDSYLMMHSLLVCLPLSHHVTVVSYM